MNISFCPFNSVPDIRMENTKGLSNQQLHTLKCDLEKEAEKLKGQVHLNHIYI
jgi:hypothetical protein